MRDARERLVYEVVRRHERGESVHAIARSVRIDRKTVRRILVEIAARRARGDDALAREVPRARAPKPSKLDAYGADIARIVAEFPDIRATRLHEELTALGFRGGYTIVREHLKTLHPPRREQAHELVITSIGKQAQADWSPYALVDGTPLYCFSCVLSHSRHLAAYFTLDMRQPTVFRMLRRMFDAHGGVPSEIVFDSMSGIVDGWDFDRPILNLRAVDFAAYYGFGLHIAPRADGAYKGKVERRFRFMEESLFNGRKFHTLDEANQTLDWWLQHKANSRKHPQLGRPITDLHAEERLVLSALPAHPYDDREMAHRLVDSYAYVAFDGNYYRAPPEQVGQWVYVRATEATVELVVAPVRIAARHPRAPRNAGRYEPSPEVDRPRRRPLTEILGCFESWGETAVKYAEAIRTRSRYAGKELARVLELRSNWAAEDVLRAIEHAYRHAAFGPRDLERILAARSRPRTLDDHLADSARDRIRRALSGAPVTQRGLAAYARLLAGPVDTLHAPSEHPDAEDPEDDPR